MGGLIGVGTYEKNGLTGKGISLGCYGGLLSTTSGVFNHLNDVNELYNNLENGMYMFRCNANILNIPIEESGILIHIQRGAKSNNDIIAQEYYTATQKFARMGYSLGLGDWVKII